MANIKKNILIAKAFCDNIIIIGKYTDNERWDVYLLWRYI